MVTEPDRPALPTAVVRAGASIAESFAGADPNRRRAASVAAPDEGSGAELPARRDGAVPGLPLGSGPGRAGLDRLRGCGGRGRYGRRVGRLVRRHRTVPPPAGPEDPHTAIIKRKKDQLGEGLGTFVRENFLSAPVVETKLRDAQIAGRLGKWLSEPVHADRVAGEAATVLRVVVELLNDDDIQQVIDRTIVKRLAEPQWGPPVGRVLSQLLAENRQEALVQLLCDRAFEWALNAGETIERVITRDSPSWSPRFVDQLVGDRIHRELMDFTDKVRRNPNHELRLSATRFLFEFADDLQNDEATIARAEAVKEQLMARDEVTRAAETAWKTLKRLVLDGVDDPSSALRTRIADSVVRIGESVRDDAELRDKVDNWIVRGAQHLVGQYGAEITTIITDTIERWDAEEASRRIELHVGRDLQFIRINGTVVGALAGLVIYTVAQFIF